MPVMDDSLVPSSVAGMDLDFVEDNPEAIFDLITIRSIQDRYGKLEPPRGPVGRHKKKHETEAVYQNETEFETFVQQFPIDDSIAACFAAENGNLPSKPENKYVSGGKRPQVSTNFSKLKKKFGWKSVEEASLLSEEEVKSRDSKRSKKGGGVFSKRHKWRTQNGGNGKKSVNFSDQSEKSGSETTVKSGDVVHTLSRDIRVSAGSDDVFRTESCSWSDSQITSFSEMFSQEMDQTVPDLNGMTSDTAGMRSRSPKDTDDNFAELLSGNSTDIIERIEDMQPNEIVKLRDHHGNNLLHRSVLLGNPDVIKYILENFPEMTSEMNRDNDTAIELAVKYGKYECLKVILERNLRRKSLGVSLVNRLLNISAQHGQPECLSLILSYMSRDQQSACALPGDTRGNTAAHLAAKHGHIHCLQALVAAGYDITSENLMQQRPLHVAHQSRSHDCFEYLLLLNICEDLLTALKTQTAVNQRLQEQVNSVKPTLDHIRACLKRYGDLCSETNQLLAENKLTIMKSLNPLQENLKLFVQHTSMDSATKRKEARDKLDELNGEIERLEDTFEFSPLAEMDGALSKLLSSLDDVTSPEVEIIQNGGAEIPNETPTVLSSLIRDVHREFMLENWDTNSVYAKYFGQTITAANGSMPFPNNNMTYINSDHNLAKHKPATNSGERKSQGVESHAGNVKTVDIDINRPHSESESSQESFRNDDKDKENLQIYSDISGTVNGTRSQNNHLDGKVPFRDITDQGNKTGESQNGNVLYIEGNNSIDKLDVIDDVKECKQNEESDQLNPTERPFTKLLSLDERIDMLIAGEKEREKISDAEFVTSSSESKDSHRDVMNTTGSVYSSTFTSITSDTSSASDWYTKLGLTSHDTTSSDDVTNDITTSTASYWWDAGDGREQEENRYNYKVSVPFGNDIKRKLHLNLENDESSYDELREHRLKSHLRSMQQTRYSSDQYRERITTSTGEIMGGFDPPRAGDRVVIDVKGALKERNAFKPMPKPRKRGKTKLFTLEDAIAVKPLNDREFRERYDRIRSSGQNGLSSMRWEEMSITDDEQEQISWSDYSRMHTLSGRSDTDITSGSHTPQSYV